MDDADIPVNLTNPGQVFACLGFMEITEHLLNKSCHGHFEWGDDVHAKFKLRVPDVLNPFEEVLDAIAGADIDMVEWSEAASGADVHASAPIFDKMTAPVVLRCDDTAWTLSHWSHSEPGVSSMKLYAGNRSAYTIFRDLQNGKGGNQGVAQLLERNRNEMLTRPLDVLGPMGGSFNMDPRAAWTAIDTGYSLNDLKRISINASPTTEFLANCGLEYARPQTEKRLAHYQVWNTPLPIALARAALSSEMPGLAMRKFTFNFEMSGKNKVVTYAQESTS